MPVNRGSAGDPSGTLAVRSADGGLIARVLKDGEQPEAGEWLGVTHWATCPQSADHKTGAKGGWTHSSRSHRWEFHDKDGNLVVFVHDQKLEIGPWSIMRRYGVEKTGEYLPDEAKPTIQQGELL
jgi:hypothetical protein